MGALIACVLLTTSCTTPAETVRLEVTGDTSIAAHPKEVEQNLGGSSQIRVKGIEHFLLMGFDLEPVAGKRVEKATLHVRLASDELWLKTVGLSSISQHWEEGTSSGEVEEGACCFAWAAYPDTPWAGPQSDFTDVTFGVGNSLCHYTDIREAGDDWLEIDVPPVLVQAMICGDSYGLVLSDEKGQTRANNDVYSREQSASKPYLTVDVVDGDTDPPPPPGGLSTAPAPNLAHLDSGAMRVTFTGPEGAFTFEGEMEADGTITSLPRYLIPHAQAETDQEIVLAELAPESDWTVRLRAVDEVGGRSEWAEVEGRTSPALEWPEVAGDPEPAAPEPRFPMTVHACPSTVKVNPLTDYVLEDAPKLYGGVGMGGLAQFQSRYNLDRVALAVGRGGFASFQVILRVPQEPTEARVALDEFTCAAGKSLSPEDVELFRVQYVKDGDHFYPEVAVPTDGTLQLPSEEYGLEGQLNQAVWVDLYVPKDAAVGEHASQVQVAIGDQQHTLPVTLTVADVTYPDTLTFNLDLNGYGPVGRHFGVDNASPEYLPIEREYHRLAHKHRATLDLLGYSHSGSTSANYAPPVEGRGTETRITDWSSWDAQFGPYLSGEAFADLPRAGVPLHNLYLWLHEDWPPPIEEYYDAPEVSAEYPLMIAEHAMRAKPVEQAFSEDHQEAFRAATRQIAEHLAERGWTKTSFHCYLNNKHYWRDPKQGGRGVCWWILDEPNWRDDWLALEYFGRLFREGADGVEGPRMVYREDLSRPRWQRSWLQGEVDLMVISRALYSKNRRCLEMQRENGATIWNYGSGNPVASSNIEAALWPLRAYLAGADAIVPWNTIGDDGDYDKGDQTAILYPGKRFGIQGPVASLRLKIWRDAAQDVEALIALGEKRGWNREELAALIVSLRGKGIDSAALAVEPWSAVDGMTVEELQALRKRVLRLLDG